MEVMSVVSRLRAFHQHVVYIDFHVPSYLALKHFVHKPLVCCPCVLQTEEHDLVAIQASINDKRGILLIFRMYEDLVVTRECVHEAEQLVPEGKVGQYVDAWEREAVFWIGLVEVGEVHTHPSLAVGLLHQDDVCQPIMIVNFPDELCL